MREMTLPLAPLPPLGDRVFGGRLIPGREDDFSLLLNGMRTALDDHQVRELMEMLPAGVYTCDEAGRISFFNRRAAELWGREPRLNDENLKYCGCHRIYLPDGTPMPPNETPTAIALREKKMVQSAEAEVERPDGSRFTASFSINPIYNEDGLACGTITVLQDVSEQKRTERQLMDAREELAERLADAAQLRHRLEAELAERARAEESLRKSEQRHREMLRRLAVACYTTDSDGFLTFYNEAAVQLWGRQPELGRVRWCGSLRLFTTDGVELPLSQCPGALALRERRSIRGVEAVVERPDGSRRWFVPHPDPLFDAAGNCTGMINVLVDVTEQREARGGLERAKEEAEAANRSKDRFLAVLSHELRTPLSPVLMLATSMAEDSELPRTVREDMAMVRRNIELETKLIDDLLDINRVTSGKLRLQMQPVDLNEEVRHVAGICRSQFLEKSIHLECQLDDMIPPLVADPARLQQVLWNVLKNAAKFTHEGGNVQVRTFAAPPGRVAVQVRDNGVGIAPDLLVKIFDAFEQGDPAVIQRSGGLGLGLAISKALIELHQGVLWAESAGIGNGSVFTIELPAGVPEPDRVKLPTAANGSGATGHLRLLLVEDHHDTARTLSRLLRLRGYSVQTASSVATALEVFDREHFDLIISDIGLPDAPGYELMRRIRLRADTKGIAMSGYGMEADIEKSQQAGFAEHLVKPVSVLHLEQAIQRARGRPVRAAAL